jgi:molybdenum cofactor cytidylyltransferase
LRQIEILRTTSLMYSPMGRNIAIILAAGNSSRLGFNKLTITIDGETVIRRSVRPFIAEGIHEVIVVTGHYHQSIKKELEGLGVNLINNPHYKEGMSTSVKAAMPFLEGADVLLFHLGDKPFIAPNSISAILNKYKEGKARIIAPLYEGKTGHPVLIDASLLREEIEMLHGDSGLREVIEKYRRDVVFIEGNDGSLFDIDTIQAIDQLRKRGYRVEENKR